MPSIASHHARNDQAGHRQEPFDIGVDHDLPIRGISLIFLFQPQGQPGVVDQDIHLLPSVIQSFPCLLCRFRLANIK